MPNIRPRMSLRMRANGVRSSSAMSSKAISWAFGRIQDSNGSESGRSENWLLALRRGYPVSVKESAKLISNIVYSSMKSYNPFYVELVVAGVDHEGPHVYTSDMSGAITSEDFMSSGSGSPIAYGVLEQGFRKEFSLEETRKLAEAAVRAAMERDPGSGNGVDVLAIPNGHSLEVS